MWGTAALTGCQTPPPQPPDTRVDVLKRVRFVDSPEGARAVLPNAILFATDSSTLFEEAQPLLDALMPTVQLARGQIIVEGHTDSTGRAERNRELSLKRAESVRNALVARQVPPSRIVTKGYAATRPTVPNARTEAEHAPNRRAEIIFVGETVASLGLQDTENKAQATMEKQGGVLDNLWNRMSNASK